MSSNDSLIENLSPRDCINYSLNRAEFCPPLLWQSLDQLTIRPRRSAGLCSRFLPRPLLVWGCRPSLGPEKDRFRLHCWPQAPLKDGRKQATVPGTGLSQAGAAGPGHTLAVLPPFPALDPDAIFLHTSIPSVRAHWQAPLSKCSLVSNTDVTRMAEGGRDREHSFLLDTPSSGIPDVGQKCVRRPTRQAGCPLGRRWPMAKPARTALPGDRTWPLCTAGEL